MICVECVVKSNICFRSSRDVKPCVCVPRCWKHLKRRGEFAFSLPPGRSRTSAASCTDSRSVTPPHPPHPPTPHPTSPTPPHPRVICPTALTWHCFFTCSILSQSPPSSTPPHPPHPGVICPALTWHCFFTCSILSQSPHLTHPTPPQSHLSYCPYLLDIKSVTPLTHPTSPTPPHPRVICPTALTWHCFFTCSILSQSPTPPHPTPE